MSELKAGHAFDVYDAYTKTGDDDAAKVYLKSEADKVIAGLKARTAELEALNHDLCERVTENDEIRLHWEEIEQTRAENERMKARIAELEEKIDGQKWRGDEWARAANDKEKQIVELKDENRKLKRALWLARANNCKWAALYFWYGYTDKPKSIRYEKAEAKCFKKAEEYE